ncbi:MAG: 5-oxoprolinase subunit PxpB, partial [Spirochaetes bacterium]|nr:5-oxoprolinase subunit PxpB [Spirochaetota bacterium]
MSAPPEDFRLEPYGEGAYMVLLGSGIDEDRYQRLAALAARLEACPPPGFSGLVIAYDSLLATYDPLSVAGPDFAAALAALCAYVPEGARAGPPGESPVIEIPVVYGGEYGPDLEELAASKGLEPAAAAALHSSRPYLVYALGFSPGFPYLGGLSPRLATPRRASPRVRIPAGSVGIADGQTGVYPRETPGGWNIIGRTPAVLFDPRRDPPALLAPGRYLRFVPIDRWPEASSATSDPRAEDGQRAEDEPRPAPRAGAGGQVFSVLAPGPQTTVQDSGRFGYESLGVPRSGAMDAHALALANILVGNGPGVAGLECAFGGLELRFESPAAFAVTGARLPVALNGAPAAPYETLYAEAGDVLSLGIATAGLRAYVAFAGGLGLEPVMGSQSTYARGGFGGLDGRALRAGDVVPLASGGEARPPLRRLPEAARPAMARSAPLRAVPLYEADRFEPGALAAFEAGRYRVSPSSDRMGVRLEGPRLAHVRGADIVSSPVLPGTVQVPGDGLPIALAADGQTMGGYARIAIVASVDLGLLGQAGPGDELSFSLVSPETAAELLRERARLYEALPDACIAGRPGD